MSLYLTKERRTKADRKFSPQDERSILRTVPKLRMEVGNFALKRVQLESGITSEGSKSEKEILPNGARQKTDARFLEEWHVSLLGRQGI